VIRSVTQRPRARIDLMEQFVYFGGEENIELAERYLPQSMRRALSCLNNHGSAVLMIPAFPS
jgi:hypothetical protein